MSILNVVWVIRNGCYLGDRGNYQLINASFGVINLLLDKTWIHHIVDPINCQRSLCNVSSNDHLKQKAEYLLMYIQ